MKDIQIVQLLKTEKIQFNDVLAFIADNYYYSPSGFKNGAQYNTENENQGSARVLYLAYLHELSKEETLALFGEHYRSVVDTPDGGDHQNIRQFLQHGWSGISFDREVLFKR